MSSFASLDVKQSRENSWAHQQGSCMAHIPSDGTLDPISRHSDVTFSSDDLSHPGTSQPEGKVLDVNSLTACQ